MFGLAFRFPAGRYHATPWGRNVNEADVAWPPEPWRILRALVACYWRKGDRERWSEDDLAGLIDALAEDLPVFCLPEGAIHAHTRHYMPIRKGKSESKTLVFDAFLHLPKGAEVVAMWRDMTLENDLLELVRDLASGMGYLGRAESWTECRVVTEANDEPNCGPAELGFPGDSLRVLVSRSPASYQRERRRLIDQEAERIRASSKKPLSERALQNQINRSFRASASVDTLPPRLVDALSVDTADLQNRKWGQPPAAYEVIYARSPHASPGVVSRSLGRVRTNHTMSDLPTIARFLVAGRPRPRIEDAVKIGEVMRAAVMSKFGRETDEETGKRVLLAPWQISGRGSGNKPIRDPSHPHAFWLPEDADDDGWIDHLTVFISGGIDRDIRSQLDRVTRIWLTPGRTRGRTTEDARIDEWHLALAGFGRPEDFTGSSRVLAASRRWRSVTPFLASGHLKKAGYRGELIRLLKRRGIWAEGTTVRELEEITVGDAPRRALNFHRFRSRGREPRPDSSGALLEIEFPQEFQGPLALGYASHFGLGMFGAR
ncbi:type I-G CRISPR-associated protein Csb2 [Candidatus Palauibacter sp.]|uniref:type I-G CRISPR-associated protein Csb2 n=1 Tax=Candidatus Palauibacter sp. TaxID=3101350 RepID=UPI003C7013A2